MVTLVGTQTDFNDAIRELIELEYDAIGAYKLAISKLKSAAYKDKLKEFLSDHERHIADIKDFYEDELVILPTSGDLIKGCLAKLKVAISSVVSDRTILKAMLTNELDTNTAYERMNHHQGVPNNPAITSALKLAYEDEVRHKAWLEAEIATFGDIG